MTTLDWLQQQLEQHKQLAWEYASLAHNPQVDSGLKHLLADFRGQEEAQAKVLEEKIQHLLEKEVW